MVIVLELSAVLDVSILLVNADPDLWSAITAYRRHTSMGTLATMDSLSASVVPEFVSEDVWESVTHDVRCGCYEVVALSPPTWSFKEVHGLRGFDG